jgi:hypothetical protein
MTFEELGELKFKIDRDYGKKFAEVNRSMRTMDLIKSSDQLKVRQALLKEYKETIHWPAQRRLRDECSKLGHKEGDWDLNYHDNGLGWQWLKCSYCGTHIKIWLDHIELKVENGQPVHNGKNWINVDNSIGISCEDRDD